MGDNYTKKEKIEILYKLYEKKIYRLAFKIINDKQDAEDCIVETFMKVLEIVDDIDDLYDMKTKKYIFTIAKNISINKYRNNYVEVNNRNLFLSQEHKLDYDSIDTRIDAIIESDRIYKLIKNLPKEAQQIIVLRCCYNLSYKLIGKAINISEQTARKRFHRAKKMLQSGKGIESDEDRNKE